MSDRITEIENRLNAATPGPWRVRECPPCTERGRLEVNIWDEPGNLLITDWCDDDEFHRPDAEFIAHAPSDVAYLLAELRKRDEALAQATDLILDLIDPDGCHYDHHGGCQAHGHLDLQPGELCPQLEAKAWAHNRAAVTGGGA